MTDNWRTRNRYCPTTCPWVTHPENDDFERCDNHDCQIVRRKPGRKEAA